jgi:SHS2 domain-containing protein
MADVSLTRTHDLTRLDVTAGDIRLAFEVALRAMLNVTTSEATAQIEAARSVPFRGEGADLSGLLLDMIGDLEAQLDVHGRGPLDLTVDGVLRNKDGGYTGWGYVHGSFEGEPVARFPQLLEPPTVETPFSGEVVIRVMIVSR